MLCEADKRGEAGAIAEGLSLRFPSTAFGQLGAAFACGLGAERRAGLAILNRDLRSLSRHSEMFARLLASLLTLLEDVDGAIDALEDAVRLGNSHYPFLARGSTMLSGLRGHPRFQTLLDVVRERWQRGGTSAADLAASPNASVPTSVKPSVAVLPFAHLSPDPENEFFADGVTDDLIAQVAKVRGLKVISRTSVIRYKQSDRSLRDIAAELGVGTIVEGSVRRAGKRVRIVAQLIDANTDGHLWSETYDRDLEDVFAVQSDVALNIAKALEASLTPGEKRRIQSKPTEDVAAYDLYLMGRHHLNKRNDESIRKAISYFEQAIERDARYASAFAGLAEAYVWAGIGYASIPPLEAFERSKTAAARALELDDSLPDVYATMGFAAFMEWDMARAHQLLERALELNPNYAPAHQWMGWCYNMRGEYAAGFRALKRALALDPLSVGIVTETGWPFGYAKLWDLAIPRYQRALELDPDFALARYNLAGMYHGKGMFDDAIREFERAVAQLRAPFIISHLGAAYAESGYADEARVLLAELLDRSKNEYGLHLPVSIIYEALGDEDAALDSLGLAYQHHEPFMCALAAEGWLRFTRLRGHPRFERLVDQLGVVRPDFSRQQELLIAAAKEG